VKILAKEVLMMLTKLILNLFQIKFMGAQHSIKGYLIQTFIAILDSLDISVKWKTITIEPNDVSEKIDIIYEYDDYSKKCIQVKSSSNQITLPECKKWVIELEEIDNFFECELRLIGPASKDVIKINRINKTKIPTPLNLNFNSFFEQASHKLDIYLTSIGISKVPVFARELLINALLAEFAIYSTSGKKIQKEDFEKYLNNLILTIYPNSVTKAAEDLVFHSQNRINEAKFKLKYDTLLETLTIIDARLSNFIKEDEKTKIVKQYYSTENTRKCYNNLLITCDSVQLINSFHKILMTKVDTGIEGTNEIINEVFIFRNLVRKELGFGELLEITNEKYNEVNTYWFPAVPFEE
jgi:hypothetical protein